jgi:hypothetical protein
MFIILFHKNVYFDMWLLIQGLILFKDLSLSFRPIENKMVSHQKKIMTPE